MSALVGYTGRAFLVWMHSFLAACELIVDTVFWMAVAPFQGKGIRVKAAVEQFVIVGFNSLPIVTLISLLMGAILAMQSEYQLSNFGVAYLVPDLVAVAAMRELAPLMTAILVAGRSGSAFTAEIGTMKVSEEIDALEVMGMNPTKYLVVPKFIGTTLAVPMVTTVATFAMIMGGYLLSTSYLDQESGLYLERSANSIGIKDFATGFTKSVFFGIVICLVGVYRGFEVEGGAEGVGKKTTSSVVTSIFLIIVVDVIFTYLFFSES